MIKKILAWFCALTGIALLASSFYMPAMLKVKWVREHQLKNTWFGKDESAWGDLTNMALLGGVEKFREPYSYKFHNPNDNGNKNIALYIYGDSYTKDVPEFAFANVGEFYHGTNTTGLAYKLDPRKKNVLILETTERFVMGSLNNYELFNVLRKDDGQPIRISHGGDGRKNYSVVVNKNLDYLLFDYNIVNLVRECKAGMNYSLFDRASGDVAISDNGKYLFFRTTVLPSGVFSSYAPVSDNTINDLVKGLDSVYDHYRKEGFSEVYFSIIPNPATILQPGGYNNLIPRLKSNPGLRMPYLDIYDTFKKTANPTKLYRIGDTHWNDNGMQIWLNVVNTELRKKSQEWR